MSTEVEKAMKFFDESWDDDLETNNARILVQAIKDLRQQVTILQQQETDWHNKFNSAKVHVDELLAKLEVKAPEGMKEGWIQVKDSCWQKRTDNHILEVMKKKDGSHQWQIRTWKGRPLNGGKEGSKLSAMVSAEKSWDIIEEVGKMKTSIPKVIGGAKSMQQGRDEYKAYAQRYHDLFYKEAGKAATTIQDRDRLAAEVEELKTKLDHATMRVRKQTAVTHEIGQQFHKAVWDKLESRGVIPEGLDQGHPAEQIVGTCIAHLQWKIEDLQAELSALKTSRSDNEQRAREAFAGRLGHVSYSRTAEIIRKNLPKENWPAVRCDEVINAFNAVLPFIQPSTERNEGGKVEWEKHSSKLHVAVVGEITLAAYCNDNGNWEWNRVLNTTMTGVERSLELAQAAAEATIRELVACSDAGVNLDVCRYYIDRDYGTLWRGPTGSDNLHYAVLEGVQADGSLCWVLRRSDKDPKWIPASYAVVEQTIESALKTHYKEDTEPAEPTEEKTSRDWIEDAEDENGNYQNKCCRCGEAFIGNKRRVVCKLCTTDAGKLKNGMPVSWCWADDASIEIQELAKNPGGDGPILLGHGHMRNIIAMHAASEFANLESQLAEAMHFHRNETKDRREAEAECKQLKTQLAAAKPLADAMRWLDGCDLEIRKNGQVIYLHNGMNKLEDIQAAMAEEREGK